MDVDAMDELMYDNLIRYFKTLAHTGYKSYDVVFKMLVMDFIYEITHTELRYYITNEDIKLMRDLLYQFFGSTCEVSLPTNRPCCECVCCDGGSSTPPPVIVPTTTTTTSTTTQPPIKPTYLILSSTVARTAYVDDKMVEIGTPVKVEVGSKVTIMAQAVVGYAFSGFYVAGSLIGYSNILQYTIPSTGTNTIELRYEEVSTTTTSTTTSSTTTTTPAPVILLFKHGSIPYTATYNASHTVSVTDKDVSVTIAELGYVINKIECADNRWKVDKVIINDTATELPYHNNTSVVIDPVFIPVGTTTTTSTSTQPPVVGNNVYYGVVKDYMSPLDFVDIPINTLMEREGTKSKTITGAEVNKFTIPQNGYYTYLIVPVNKVELQYADFTSGGITTVCYDNTKENIPDDTNNGIFYSKYTRGGVNANQGGTYNGINYDVYFVYNNYGGAPELINVKAKNK
nr:MAG TPA: hypothetical protein [Bacteriophage sp.]